MWGNIDNFENAEQIYVKSGISGRVGFGKNPVILVIDLQKGYTNLRSPLAFNLDDVIKNTNEILIKGREKNILIVFLIIGYEKHGKDAGIWSLKVSKQTILQLNSWYTEIDPRLEKGEGEVFIVKKYASAFFGTSLASLLNAQQIDTCIVTGCTTSGCVRATVVDSLQYGFRTIIPKECVGDRTQIPHQAALFDMNAKYGDVVSKQEVLNYLDGFSLNNFLRSPLTDVI